jgi:hypothetical protein
MEDFTGSELTRPEMDVRGLRIDPIHREDEAGLMQKRWFDYRGLHPVAATYLYAHFYKQQTHKFYAQNVDIRTVEDARAFFPDDIFMSRDLTSMWLARSAADRLSIPYPFILQFAQERFIARLQHKFPRPNQLYGDEIEVDVMQAWDARIATQLTYSREPRYQAAGWRKTMDQAQHLMFVFTQIERRPVQSRHRLLGRLLHEGVIAPWMAKGRFGEAMVDAAESYAASLR